MSVFDEFIAAFKAMVSPFEAYVVGFTRNLGEDPIVYFSMPATASEKRREKFIYNADVLLEHIGFGEHREADHLEINGSIVITSCRIICTRCKTEITPVSKSDGKKISAINISTDLMMY